jgi:uncharacterized protein
MCSYRKVRFVWDESKRRENLLRHGIDFRDVPAVFEGPTVTYADDRFPYEDYRYITIGLLRVAVVLIAHTETDDEIRIIHARKANRATAERYFAAIGD